MEINDSLRDHQVKSSELLSQLHSYLPRIVHKFYGELPLPALSFDRDRITTLGSYRSRDGLTLTYRININSRHERPIALVLVTLTHELGHLWENINGNPRKPPYHSKSFRLKMTQIGIPCDYRGRNIDVRDPFIGFLREIGVDFNPSLFTASEFDIGVKGNSKLKKWSCTCTNVWAAVPLSASCQKCGQEFRRQI